MAKCTIYTFSGHQSNAISLISSYYFYIWPRENKHVCRSYSSLSFLPASLLMLYLPWVQQTLCTMRYRSVRHQAFLFVMSQPVSGISCIGKEILVIKGIFSIWKLSVICLSIYVLSLLS